MPLYGSVVDLGTRSRMAAIAGHRHPAFELSVGSPGSGGTSPMKWSRPRSKPSSLKHQQINRAPPHCPKWSRSHSRLRNIDSGGGS